MKKEQVQETVKLLMIERDKLRAKIIAVSKNRESRSNYNSLLQYTKRYAEITTDLQGYGKKVSISSDLLKHDYWKDRYKAFNSNNPNIIMPDNTEYALLYNTSVIHTFTATDAEYDKIQLVVNAISPAAKGRLSIKKL